MRLTAEHHPEAIKRYRHIKRAGRRDGPVCGARFGESRHRCTRERAHRGPHVVHGRLGRLVAVWDDGGSRPAPSRDAPKKTRPGKVVGRAPVGLPARRPRSALQGMTDFAKQLFSSVEDVALLTFLLAFIGFAIHWFILLL